MLKCCLGIDYGRYFCWKRDDFVKEEAISFERKQHARMQPTHFLAIADCVLSSSSFVLFVHTVRLRTIFILVTV